MMLRDRLRRYAAVVWNLRPTTRREVGWLIGLLVVAAAAPGVRRPRRGGVGRRYARLRPRHPLGTAQSGGPGRPHWTTLVGGGGAGRDQPGRQCDSDRLHPGRRRILALTEKRAAAVLVAASVGGGTALSSLLKLGFARPRPDLVPHAVEVYTAGFPSGHAMLSAVTYLTLGALLIRVQPRWRVKVYILVPRHLDHAAGRHQSCLPWRPLADGRAGGLVRRRPWTLLCSLVALRLQREGKVETATSS